VVTEVMRPGIRTAANRAKIPPRLCPIKCTRYSQDDARTFQALYPKIQHRRHRWSLASDPDHSAL